jgi:mannosyltransferase
MSEILELGPTFPFPRVRALILQFFQSQVVVLTAITTCGALLRLWHLGAKSFWVDEAFSAVMAAAPWHEFWQEIRAAELNMLPYYLLLRIWMHFGSSEAWLRLLSALFGIATIPAVYRLASRLFDRRVGLLSASLLAVHPGHIRFSQEARSYSMTVLLLTVFALLLLRALCYPKRLNWGACAAVASVAAYTHFFAVLACAAQVIGIGVRPARQHLRAAALPVLACGLLIVPIGLFALNHDVGQLSGVMRPQFHHLLRVIFLLTGNGPRFALYLLLWVSAVWQSFRMDRDMQRSESGVRSPYPFLLAWLFLPLFLTVVLSFWKAALLPRYLLVSLPAAVILGAAGAMYLPRHFRAVIAVLLIAFSLKSVASNYHGRQQNWRSAVEYVLSHARSGDAMAIMPASSAVVFDYYGVLRNAQGPRLQRIVAGDSTPAAQNIWIVTISRPLKIRAESRKAGRWREAEAELEQRLTTLGPTYTVSEARDSQGVRVLLLSRDDTVNLVK